jgi:tetratricopeptide (TPR) repeat protein
MSKRVAIIVLTLAFGGIATAWGFLWKRSLPLSQARRAMKENRFEEAVRLAETRLATSDPDDRDAMLIAARAYAHLGQWAEAEAYFTQVPSRAPDDLRLRARGLESRRLWSEAAYVYEMLLHELPADGDALQHLAAIRVQQDRPKEALILARTLTQIPTFESAGHIIAAMVENQMGNQAKAIEHYEEALRISPDLKGVPTERWQVLELLAQALVDVGRAAEAEQYALEVKQLSEGPMPCFILGQARQQLGDDEGAYNYWKEALARDPKHLSSIVEVAQFHLRKRNLPEAMKYATRAGELAPDNITVKYILSTIQKHMDQQDKSVHLPNRDSP